MSPSICGSRMLTSQTLGQIQTLMVAVSMHPRRLHSTSRIIKFQQCSPDSKNRPKNFVSTHESQAGFYLQFTKCTLNPNDACVRDEELRGLTVKAPIIVALSPSHHGRPRRSGKPPGQAPAITLNKIQREFVN